MLKLRSSWRVFLDGLSIFDPSELQTLLVPCAKLFKWKNSFCLWERRAAIDTAQFINPKKSLYS
jgi:hypothetical protein